jgi:hypothetical protein
MKIASCFKKRFCRLHGIKEVFEYNLYHLSAYFEVKLPAGVVVMNDELLEVSLNPRAMRTKTRKRIDTSRIESGKENTGKTG